MPIHLRAEPGDYAPAVLCPGDPRRATYIANTFFDPGFRMVNEERGMLGYTGTYKGRPVSVQTTGKLLLRDSISIGAVTAPEDPDAVFTPLALSANALEVGRNVVISGALPDIQANSDVSITVKDPVGCPDLGLASCDYHTNAITTRSIGVIGSICRGTAGPRR